MTCFFALKFNLISLKNEKWHEEFKKKNGKIVQNYIQKKRKKKKYDKEWRKEKGNQMEWEKRTRMEPCLCGQPKSKQWP